MSLISSTLAPVARFLPHVVVRDNRIYEASYQFFDLSGYGKDELIHHDVRQFFQVLFKKELDPRMLLCNAVDGSGKKEAFFLFTKSYHVRVVDILVYHGINADELIVVFIEKPNSRLEERFHYLEQLYLSNYTGIAVYSVPDFILLKANQRYLDCLDEPCNQLCNSIGCAIGEIITGWSGSPLEKLWCTSLQSGEAFQIKEYKYEGLKKGVAYWDAIITPIFEGGRIHFLVVNSVDVTDRVLDRKLIEIQASKISQQKEDMEKVLKLKDEFFSFISHEFKTPLTVINAAVQAMERLCRGELSQRAWKFITQIKQNSLRQLRLVNNVLDLTRIENGYLTVHKKNMDIVSVTRIITESVQLYARHKGIELAFQSAIGEKVIPLDDEKYERILLNLLSNAIKYTPQGKGVTVNVACDREKLYVTVRDEGMGIPPARLGQIFELYSRIDTRLTREVEGTGIGLSLVKLISEALGGEVTVESQEGAGSAFTLSLPLKSEVCICAEETAACGEMDYRLIQSVAIEFSDIYFQD